MVLAYRILVLSFVGFLLLAAPSVAQVGENLGLINPNLASADELVAVPGLNSAAVEEILAGRPFLSMLVFHEIVEEHVSESAYDQVYGALWILTGQRLCHQLSQVCSQLSCNLECLCFPD